MKGTEDSREGSHIRQRLLDEGLQCFLKDDYRHVSMRKVAAHAGASMSMIHYYFNNKEGFFEEILRNWLHSLSDKMKSPQKDISPKNFEEFFLMYYRAALVHPRFPLLILNTLNSPHAPGARFLCETILEHGRKSGIHWINKMKSEGKITRDIDPELLRIAAVSMCMLPMLIRDFLSQQLNESIDEDFFSRLSSFYARILTHGIVNTIDEKK